MKRYSTLCAAVFATIATAVPAFSQTQHEKQAGETQGPIHNIEDLQDTGRMIFKLADEDDNGRISQKEAVDAGNLVLGGFFFRADQNGDGVLSEPEVKQAGDAFLSTKPWLRYVIETVKASPKPDAAATSKFYQVPMINTFALIDTNNDKQLQSAELRQAVQNTVQVLFATADTNRDGELSTTEVNAGVAGIARQARQIAFQEADTDNNGQISQAEFEKAIIEPSRVAFRVVDLNHDGQISRQELDTARQVMIGKLRMLLSMPEAPNSLRNSINSTLGATTPSQPVNAPDAGVQRASNPGR